MGGIIDSLNVAPTHDPSLSRITTVLNGDEAQLDPNCVVGPFALNPEVPTRSRFVVALVTDVQAERQFTFEEVRDQHDRFLEGSDAAEKPGEPIGPGILSPRESLEKTIWSCLVQRK